MALAGLASLRWPYSGVTACAEMTLDKYRSFRFGYSWCRKPYHNMVEVNDVKLLQNPMPATAPGISPTSPPELRPQCGIINQ